MSPADFLAHLEQQQIRLQAENGQLRFFAKPGALTPELRAQIVARKAELLELLQRPAAAPTRTVLPRAAGDTLLPLSFAQERLWFLDQLEGPSATYNVYEAWQLRGPINVPAFTRALGELVRRHEALRTTFTVAAHTQEAAQEIHADMAVPLEHTDLSAGTSTDRMAEARRLANEAAAKPFDLAHGPLMRIQLVTLAPAEHVLTLVVHHIVFDGWSADLVYRELEQLYAAYCQGRQPALPPSEIHYADYAAWERTHLTGETLAASLRFWQKYLEGAPDQLDLPSDFTRPPSQTYRGDQTHTVMAPALVQRLRDLGRLEHATLYHTVMAAWKILLRRYSSQTDLVVGTAISNRRFVELEPVIGFFVNTVALRTRLEDGVTVRQAVARVKETTLAALSHNDIPFEQLVQSFNPKRSLGITPIFQVCVSFQSQTDAGRRLHDLELKPLQLEQKTAKFDLTLWLTDTPEGLRTSLEYATDLFSRRTAERMLAHFGRILEEMTTHPDAAIEQLRMTTDAERDQLVLDWNRTARDYPRDRRLHELFEEQARRQPDAVAVVFGDEALTYTQLDQRAGRLADLLRSRGVGPDVLVGLCVERSLDMLVGIFGILKAGGAYVPIDPAYPADRIAFVLEDSHAPVLITQRPLLDLLPPTNAYRILLDEPLPAIEHTIAAPAAAANSANLAYVLYTSGSTGKPKGVQIPHRAVVNFLNAMRREPGLAASDVLLAVTTLSFDIAGLELHLPLTTGARIILASREVATDGQAVLDAIDRHGVTVLQATPATWRLMLASGWAGTPRLKALCGGEALPADLAAEMLPRCAELWNMYGPTETTIWSTCCRVTDPADIHIGRPIDNTDIFILDPHNQPLPVGLPGELLIGGDGLACGYHNRPDLTADRFVPHPFKPGARLYRTGDLARYRPDGTINCLGRLDFQVKIRGFRIELGEIETQLAGHPEVKQNVVVAREDTPGDKRLVAYLVPRPGATLADAALRDHLRGKLPEYMVPVAFVLLETLPLTPNGKIDRKALPAPGASAAVTTRNAIAPRNPTEERLVAIFGKVLGVPVASVTDSFFDLGGHSLLATRLMAAIENEFGQRLPLAKLFIAPSVEQLAAVLSVKAQASAQTGWDSLVPIRPGEKGPALFLVHGAGGNILLYRELARELRPDIGVFGFQSQGLDGQSTILTSVDQMARRYTEELLRFQPKGPYYLGGYCMGGIVAYEMARLLRSKGHEVGPVAMLDSYNLNAVQVERTSSARFGAFRQKVIFHFENLRQMSFAEKLGYLREKFRMLVEAVRQSLSHRFRRASAGQADSKMQKSSLAAIQDINHRAGWNHAPGLYDGPLVLFKPRKNYDFFPDPDMGWGIRVSGRIEKVEIPANPHAMLINPHVRHLAAGITAQVLKSTASGSG